MDRKRLAADQVRFGVVPQPAHRLFQLFERIDDSQATGGTGLGLVVCKRLLEVHGGWIKVESAKGRGSTFSFGLPVEPV